MKLYTKEEMISNIKKIINTGWHKSVKKTVDKRNDGAVGNTLEILLGIKENNLPIPNAQEWELKGQRKHSTSLVTLKHIEPSPTGAKIVSSILLPMYGWRHKEAGRKYPEEEMSFRSTTSATSYTKRGFKVVVNRTQRKLIFDFDSSKIDINDSEVSFWYESIKRRVGVDKINPEPYWGFDDLKYAIGSKLMNCFYVIADTKIDDGHEYFKYEKLLILSSFSFDKFVDCVDQGYLYIDFDARTGHNHGTKFRLRQDKLPELYNSAIYIS
ncbi:MAG: MvaI/BcnI family restriction endonuclease [Candidatus Magnetominusculus sp. LBB02]|nr:MvaI/BcnI family restriction endonuclease [Candidatus Magnetominusculus sp. LBB02]